MFRININSKHTETNENKSLLRYLRDDLRITSAKDGCSEGACGTCTILFDGEAVKACTLTTKMADGHSIVTVEGLTEWEKRVYDYAFGKAGAVQCGFCIPGMVMAAYYLLENNPNPTEEEIRMGISGNICRCTGYDLIVDSILIAAKKGEEIWKK